MTRHRTRAMKQPLTKIMPLLSFLTLLSGCAGMNGQFGCAATAGSSCTPISQVNANATAGDFDHQPSGNAAPLTRAEAFRSVGQPPSDHYTTLRPGAPVRSGERIQRIWIAPYQDRTHTYHAPSAVYAVMSKPQWRGAPAHVIQSTDTEQ